MEKSHILVINPGSTSTKIAVFDGETKALAENISHPAKEIAKYKKVIDQGPFRQRVILDFLSDNRFDVSRIAAVVGRGGLLTPMESGTYRVTPEMTEYLRTNLLEHASNLGAILADSIAKSVGVEAYIVDPVVVDEMSDVARITGIPGIRRISIFHALNQKAAAREAAGILKKKYEECNLIVAHLGGGISVGAHKRGRVVDVNNALNGDGPIAPERAGSIPAWSLIELATSGKYDLASLRRLITGSGGVVAYTKTNDMRRVEEMIRQGDQRAELIYRAMIYTVAKEIGSLAPVLEEPINAIVITGGIAHDSDFVERIRKMVEFLAPVIVLPGEDEMAALAKGAFRVIRGEEKAKTWNYTGGPS